MKKMPIALAVALSATFAALPVAPALAADASVAVSAQATGQSLGRIRETLSYTIDGKQIVVPAGWVSGDGFSLMAIIAGYTTRTGSAVDIRAEDGSASLRVERMAGVAPKDALAKAKSALKGKGYDQFANNLNARSGATAYRMVATGSGLRANVYAMASGNDTVVVTETYDLDQLAQREPQLAAMRETLSLQSGRKPAPTPTPTPTAQPIGGDPRTWSPTTDLRYRVGSITHEAEASKWISDNGYVMYALGNYEFVPGKGFDILQRRSGGAFLTVYLSSKDAATSLDQQVAYLSKQGYAETQRMVRKGGRLDGVASATLVNGKNALRVTTIAAQDGGCYVLRESFGKDDAAGQAEMGAMVETFVRY